MKKTIEWLRSGLAANGILLACFAFGELAMAQLPPAIMADRYLVQAERELADGDPGAAVETLNRIVALQAEHSLDIPDVFWFRRAQAAHDAGLYAVALESLVLYLENAGQGGENYRAALELYDAAELAKAEADARAAERAEAERLAAERIEALRLAAEKGGAERWAAERAEAGGLRAERAEAERLAAERAEAERLAAERAEAERLAAEEEALAAAVAAVAPEMVTIPAGRFRLGCVSGQACDEDEFPIQNVTIRDAFAVSRYEVTFAEWDACVLDGGCGGYRPDDEGWGRGTRPVINVSWEDAQSYVSWLSSRTGVQYRLLTEAEWEYVARAGSETAYSWGNGIGSNRANCDGCGSQWDGWQTAPVDSFEANRFGVHDMHGNVWEWVEDCYDDRYRRAHRNGRAWLRGNCNSRVLRGGSWSNFPRVLRAAIRGGSTTGNRYNIGGFRVAWTLTP